MKLLICKNIILWTQWLYHGIAENKFYKLMQQTSLKKKTEEKSKMVKNFKEIEEDHFRTSCDKLWLNKNKYCTILKMINQQSSSNTKIKRIS